MARPDEPPRSPQSPGAPTRARVGGTCAAMRLAARRVAGRRGPAALVAVSVAATIAVLGALFGVGAEAADVAIQRALAERPPVDRAVTIERFTTGAVREHEADVGARELLGRVASVTAPVVSVTIFPPDSGPNLVVTVDDVRRVATLIDGRLPAPCSGGPRCEAVLIHRPFRVGSEPIPTTSTLGDITLDIVGSVDLAPSFPIDIPTQAGDPVLVDGSGVVTDPGTASLNRTTFWIAALDPSRVHSWDLDNLRATLDTVSVEIARTDAAMSLAAPDRTFNVVASRAAVANGRIVFVGSLIVAVLFAFAFFAAAIDRDDLRSEHRRLVAAGARRRHLLALVGTEALLPSIAGAVLGWALAIGAVLVVGQAAGEPPIELLLGSLLTPTATAFLGGAAVILAVAVAIGLHPGARRFLGARTIAIAAVPVAVVLVWDRVTRGATSAVELASGAAGPGTVLLPGLLGLTVILASLAILPPIFRWLASRSTRLPLAVRLAVLSIAREPLRPAATLTLLGFSFGSALFGLGYGTSLHQSAADTAAYATGLDARIEAPSSQTPFVRSVLTPLRAGQLGDDVRVAPLLRLSAQTATHLDVAILGLDPAVIPEFRSWRSDFSSSSPAQLRDAIAQPGDWTMPGHPVAAGARSLEVTATAALDPTADDTRLELTAVVDTAGGGFRTIQLGPLEPGRHSYHGQLLTDAEAATTPADQPFGWRIVALEASLPGLESGFGPDVDIKGRLAIEGLNELADPTRPIDLDVSIVRDRQVIRALLPSDGLVLPAIVSPGLRSERDSAGQLSIELLTGLVLHLRPVATADWFPTMTDPTRQVIVIDEAPLLLAINGFQPGQGLPNEALLSTPSDARTAEVVAALGEDPFPTLGVQSRPALEAVAADDPFASGMTSTLFVGAVAGLVLALAGMLLAAVAELRDERGELADLEEQGLPPAALRRLTIVRSGLVLLAALVTGTALGVGLTWFGTAAIAAGVTEAVPIPPLVVVIPWPVAILLALSLLAAVGGGTLLLSRGRFGEGRLLREAEA